MIELLKDTLSPELVVAFGSALAAVITALLVRGKANSTPSAASIVQQAIRPETEAEIRAADALEKIAASITKMAKSVDRIDRQTFVLVDRGNRSR
ncbi:hypothetical protein [Puniceibacterium sp. IMCC21224]|uniref:hypothetical protein n=1 Tax=Puniceibacterium sp. IMCC21224 TaxID=1618204 RepID=UPI00064DEA1E|nr:hypothetical protein [Puniceibacterium sp. IMCC21224]KMK68607.1 hypothetical protein IMCC21224_113490 [Puniceibacterium sp. IMCC21224]